MTQVALFGMIVFVMSLNTAHAQDPTPASMPMSACKEQIELSCKSESENKDLRGLVKCLIRNDDKLSVECKQEIQRFAQASRQTTPPGGGPLGALGGLAGPSAQVPSLAYEGRVLSDRNDSHDKGSQMNENSLQASIPVLKNEADALATTVNGSVLHFREPVTLDSGRQVPTDLFRTELGLQYSHQIGMGKSTGLRVSYGYNGDELNWKTETYNLIANYGYPGRNGSYWVWMLMISNNSPFGTLIPIPGFLYITKSPTFTGVFGIPVLSMQWTPVDPWSYSFSIFGPQVKSEVAFGEIDTTQYFLGLAWRQQKFILSERENKEDQLTIEEKTLELGARRPLYRSLFGEIQIGRSFDRSIYIGKGLFNHSQGLAELDPNTYLRWSLKATF